MNRTSFGIRLFLLTLALFLSACQKPAHHSRHNVNLSGQWQFALDEANAGIQQKWFASDLPDVIELPGTTDLRRKGFANHDTSTIHLNRLHKYEGPAWYRKKLTIPPEWQDKHVQLILERTKSSMVWVDELYVGESRLLQSPQTFDVSAYLSPGEHTISIRVDNTLKLTPYGNVHIYTDETQTNWNGIIGDIRLEAAPKTYIADMQVFPDIDKKKIRVQLAIANGLHFDNVEIELLVQRFLNGEAKELKPLHKTVPCDSFISIEYALGEEMKLWDDYLQPLYQLTATISHGEVSDSQSAPFGMRKFSAEGTQFAINGRTTFLRGKHDACVFPLTGFPPMDVEGWKRVYQIARSYGINHFRFHSYCPPEAAFQAADEVGIFLQAELPFWGGLASDSVAAMLLAEGQAMLKSYANHPSFVMFCAGNEIWSGHDRVEKIITALKEKDNRLLYATGANNNIGYVGPAACADFFVAARTPFAGDTTLTHTRLTHAFVDSRDGGILNRQRPSTTANFDYAVDQIKMPLISHEIGQYQIYPDYSEIEKYTGVLRAWNLEVFRNRLQRAGILEQNVDFQRASGAWSALCYKAEMEAALRTAGMAGFQLLDLQDYPGQGTALVGILDAFMDSKNVITPQGWRQSCNDVVLLLEFPQYCWTNDEHFIAKLRVANYSNKTLEQAVEWAITDESGGMIQQGEFTGSSINNGGLVLIGEIDADLAAIDQAKKLLVEVSIAGSGYSNTYPIWVYPAATIVAKPADILISDVLNDNVLAALNQGGKVLLFPKAKDVKGISLPGLFPPDFWNYGMFKGISESNKKPVSPGTLGILTDPAHPLFNSFPTDFHTNWQWFSIIKASYPLILDDIAGSYRPIVQVIDNLERNHKLGLVFEFKVGAGKLLVCMAQLLPATNDPASAQFYLSMVNYCRSDAFNPSFELDKKILTRLLTKEL